MKNILKSRLFIAIITAIICITGTAYATIKIQADEIGYDGGAWKKSNGEDITNVKDAIDELYSKNISINKLLDSEIGTGDTSTALANWTNPNSTPEKIIIVLNWFSSYMGGSVSEPEISITGDISNLRQVSDMKSGSKRYIYNYVYTCTLAGKGNVSASLKGNGAPNSYGGEYVSIYSVK